MRLSIQLQIELSIQFSPGEGAMTSLMMSRIASGHSVGMYPWQGIFIQSDNIAFRHHRGM